METFRVVRETSIGRVGSGGGYTGHGSLLFTLTHSADINDEDEEGGEIEEEETERKGEKREGIHLEGISWKRWRRKRFHSIVVQKATNTTS